MVTAVLTSFFHLFMTCHVMLRQQMSPWTDDGVYTANEHEAFEVFIAYSLCYVLLRDS